MSELLGIVKSESESELDNMTSVVMRNRGVNDTLTSIQSKTRSDSTHMIPVYVHFRTSNDLYETFKALGEWRRKL